MAFRYWLLLIKDVKAPIGGVKQMHRLAEALCDLGRRAVLVQEDAQFHPGWFNSNVDSISLDDWTSLDDLDPSTDRVIIPETFITVINKYAPGIPKVVFNQNSSYTFGVPPETLKPVVVRDIYFSDSVDSVLCVSRYDELFLSSGLGLTSQKVNRIVNPIETHMFSPSQRKKKQIVYMPRKNPRDSLILSSLLQSLQWNSNWSLRALSGCTHQEVASAMSESLIFLSFGHPEGFGLPVAEAIASGCAVIGYSGLGGNELFDDNNGFGVTHQIQFGDLMGFINAIREVVDQIENHPETIIPSLISGSAKIKEAYGKEMFLSSVDTAFSKIEQACASQD